MQQQYNIVLQSIIVVLFLFISSERWIPLVRATPFQIPSYGRWQVPTIGEVWPKPQQQTSRDNFFILTPSTFHFEVTGQECDIIDEALRRYYKLIFYPGGTSRARSLYRHSPVHHQTSNYQLKRFRAFLDTVQINLTKPCEFLPFANMTEKYSINIDTPEYPMKAAITSDSVWGILRGLETLSQLVYSSAETGVAYQLNATQIVDFPRFPHRGLLIDTARHFIPLKTLKKMTDLMAQNKMNVFHWHMVDDASFPFESQLFPNLSRYGAFQPYSHIYSIADVREIVEYARMRGIRVVPEFDSPGHTQSWGRGMPELLTQCYDDDGLPLTNEYGPINPVREENYEFLKKFYGEVFSTFPDSLVHLGGDEVEFKCWASNPEIRAFMQANGWGENWGQLEQFYIERLCNVTQNIADRDINYIVWQEIIDDNATLSRETIVNVWKNDQYKEALSRITKLGYPVILSSPWYLNKISYGIDWEKYYIAEPLDFDGTDDQKMKVIGGAATMWTEFVDSVSLIQRTWPRASTVAERLWSDRQINNASAAASRLEEHRCRLLKRGYLVDPVNGVNFCEQEFDQ